MELYYKIDALLRIIGPSECGTIDYNTYRSQIPKALHTSLRSARRNTRTSLLLESISFIVAVSNLVYVILLSLTDKKNKEFLAWVKFVIPLGAVIVIGGLSEAILRLCFFKNKHNFFDTLAVLAGAGSMYGENRWQLY